MSEFKGMLRLVGDPTTLPAAVEVATGEIRIRSSGTELGTWPLSEVAVEEREDGFLLTLDDGQLLLTPFDRSGFADSMVVEKKVADKAAKRRRRRWRRSGPRRTPEPEPMGQPGAGEPASTAPAPSPGQSSRSRIRWRWRGRRRRHDETDPPAESTLPRAAEDAPEATSEETTGAGEPETSRGGETGLGARIAARLAASTRRERIVAGAVLFVLLLAAFAARVLTILVLVGGGLVVLLGILAYIDDYVAVKIPSPWTPLRVIALGLGVLVVGAIIPLILL